MTPPPVRVDLARLEELCANKEYIAPEKVRVLIEAVRLARAVLGKAERRIVGLIDVTLHAGGHDWTAVQDAASDLPSIRAALARIGELVSGGD